MAELADASALGADEETRGSSTLPPSTKPALWAGLKPGFKVWG